MQKDVFYNNKSSEKNFETVKAPPLQSLKKKARVDINKLLNRVKLEKHNESKKKVIFFIFGISLISFTGLFVTIIR